MRYLCYLLFSVSSFTNAIAAITFDASTSSFSNTPVTSLSYSATVSGTDRLLVVGVHAEGSGVPLSDLVTAVTFNSDALTRINTLIYSGVDKEVSLWYMVAPDTGTFNVVVTLDASASLQSGAISLTGVHQTNALDANNTASGTSTTPSVNVTTVANHTWVVDCVGESGGLTTIAVGANQTSRWEREVTTGSGGGSTEGPVAPPGATTMSWTIGASAAWGIAAASFKPAASSGSNFLMVF